MLRTARSGSVRRRILRVVLAGALLALLATPAQSGVSEPVSIISTPDHGGIYAYVGSIEATAAGVPTIEAVDVSLRMKMTNGRCKHFNGERFVAGKCNTVRWLDAAVEGFGWAYELPDGFLLRPSDPNANIRHYVAMTRAQDAVAGAEDSFEAGRNVNRFDVIGAP